MKKKDTAIVLAIFLGGFGVHRFYLGRHISGVLYLVFCWTFIPLILAFFEAAMYFFMSQEAWDLRFNEGAPTKKCPQCAELIQRTAKKCRHCGSKVEQSETGGGEDCAA